MSEQLYPELSPAERKEKLAAMAYHVEEQEVPKYFSSEEMAQMRTDITTHAIAERNLSNEKKELTKELNAKISIEKKGMNALLTHVTKGCVEVKQKVYQFDDQENGVMNTYDEEGNFLNSRKLRPSERQGSILSLALKTGTHD